MAVLSVENVHFSYNSRPVLAGASHVFAANSFTAVLGTNGSGKSTLLKLMTRILHPAKGSISLNEEDISHIERKTLSRKIAYVQQSHTPVFATTVFDTVMAGRNPYTGWMPSEKDKNIVWEIMRELNLEELSLRDISQLSGGQKQKVYLARALAQQTPVIILDEPTSNLDPKHQVSTLSLLKDICSTGKTIIMAIHDINQVAHHCSHFVMLKNGQVLSADSMQNLTPGLLEELYEIEVKKITDGEKNHFVF